MSVRKRELSRRTFQQQLLALGAATALPLGANAQGAFPNKPVRLVVTYPPGGSSDVMARIMAQKLQELWGQAVVVESKPGAAGSIGMDYAAKQPADGYTCVLGNLGPVTVNPMLSKLPYKLQDFIPIALTATGPNVLAVPNNSPFKTLAELVNAAKAKPGTLSFGTSGPGSLAHLASELLMREAKIKMNHVPYKGGGQAVNDLLGGQIDLMISDVLPVAQHIKGNRLRALAITSANRSPLFPDLPTFAESGLRGIVAENWWGLLVPANTPAPIVSHYHASLAKVMVDQDLKDKYAGLGVQARFSTQDEFKSFLSAEGGKYAKLIADNNIKAE